MVAQIINLVLRGLQFFFTLLIMAITGNMIALAFGGNPSAVNYAMFVSVISMVSLIYLITATVREKFAIHPALMIAVDALNTLFFFCGGIALAATLGVRSCGNLGYLNSNSITNGAANKSMRCHEAQTVTAFLWFGFAAYAASAFLDFFQTRGSGSKGGSRV